MGKKSRRKFLKESISLGAAAGLATGSIKAQSALSSASVLGANSRVRIGLIGCGGQGRSDLQAALRLKNVECVALCDVDDEQTGRAFKMVEEQAGQHPSLITRDFRKVIEQKDIDAVIIGTPDHWHALTTILACQAGKDVYVEKPLSLSIGEGRVMVDVA